MTLTLEQEVKNLEEALSLVAGRSTMEPLRDRLEGKLNRKRKALLAEVQAELNDAVWLSKN